MVSELYQSYENIPIGFLHALCESKSAMRHFARLTPSEKEALIGKARRARTKDDLRVLALSLDEEANDYL